MKNLTVDVLYIQPYDRPWDDLLTIKQRSGMYMSRAMFEVGYLVPLVYSMSFIDLNVSLRENFEKTTEEIVVSAIQKQTPKLVFVSFPSYAQGAQVHKIVKAVNDISPNSKIILGGAVISLIKDAPMKWGWPITGCYNGFGNEIPEIVRDCLSGNYSQISGMYWTCTGGKKSTGQLRLIDQYTPENLYTAHHRFSFQDYINRIRGCGLEPMGAIEMTRGCKNDCSFCAINKNRLGCFVRNSRTVVDEAYFLASYGIKYLHIIDPTMGIVKKETSDLLNYFADFHQTFPHVAIEVLTRSPLVTKIFAKSLQLAGVVRCGIGMETLESDDLLKINKKISADSVRRAVVNLAECGIEAKLFHILFPKRISEKTIKFFLDISKENIPFIVQSSFLRKLPDLYSQHPFLEQDQTVYGKNDSVEQLMEWMLANLPFKSMDIEGADEKLKEKVDDCLKKGIELKKMFLVANEKKFLGLNLGEYKFTHVPNRSMHTCLRGGELNEQ